MERKTAEQIAEGIALPRIITSGATLRELMVKAIEADRANREESLKLTLCPLHTEDGEAQEGVTTHCEVCGVRVWE